MRIAHISDCHIVDPGQTVADRVDSAAALARVVARIGALDPAPDLVVATGDLVNNGSAHEYDRLTDLLAPLRAPVLPCPGNHDDRTELRRRFAVLPNGAPGDPIDHVVDAGGVRFACLDTSIPGRNDGRLTDHQIAWLDAELGAEPDQPTVVVQHHPPFLSGAEWMDRYALDAIRAECGVLARHDHVIAVLAGHYHRALGVRLPGGTLAWCAPSAAVQLDLDAPDTTYTAEAPAFAVHDLAGDGALRTAIVTVADLDSWRPAWSL